jgi:hypothetical protein
MSAVIGRFKSAGRDCHSATREKIETISDAIDVGGQLTLRLSGIVDTKPESPCDALYAIYKSGMWRAN